MLALCQWHIFSFKNSEKYLSYSNLNSFKYFSEAGTEGGHSIVFYLPKNNGKTKNILGKLYGFSKNQKFFPKTYIYFITEIHFTVVIMFLILKQKMLTSKFYRPENETSSIDIEQ